MTGDHEPYLADPREPRPRARLARLRPLLLLALAVLVAGAVVAVGLETAREDPALLIPSEILSEQAS